MSELLQHLGPRLAHVTAARNLPSIREHGLLPASALAARSGTDPATLAMRRDRIRLTAAGLDATLNHQRPILYGRAAAERMIDGFDAAGWAAFLDERIFFWPARHGAAFRTSIARDLPLAVLWFDTARLLAACGHRLTLSPINSGNFRQGGARVRRGAWLFVPARAGLPAFRENRQTRGFRAAPDTVREVSMTGTLPPDILHETLCATETAPNAGT